MEINLSICLMLNKRMLSMKIMLIVTLVAIVGQVARYLNSTATHEKDRFCAGNNIRCPKYDRLCMVDKTGYASIHGLFQMHDLNRDDMLTPDETEATMRDLLASATPLSRPGYAHYHTRHGNHLGIVKLKNMWKAWTESPVYSWTHIDVGEWMARDETLSKYKNLFKKHKIEGVILPRLTDVKHSYLVKELGLTNMSDVNAIQSAAIALVMYGQIEKESSLPSIEVIIAFLSTIGAVTYLVVTYIRRSRDAELQRQREERAKDGLTSNNTSDGAIGDSREVKGGLGSGYSNKEECRSEVTRNNQTEDGCSVARKLIKPEE